MAELEPSIDKAMPSVSEPQEIPAPTSPEAPAPKQEAQAGSKRQLMTVYDPQSRKPINTTQDDAFQGLVTGQYTVPADQTYGVIKDNGELGGEAYTVQGTELVKALKGGFYFDTPETKAIREYKADNSGVLGGAKAFAASAANQALLGIPEVAGKLGVARWMPDFINKNTLTMDEWQALHEVHPGSSFAGGTAGFIASLLGGPGSIAARAAVTTGELGERGLAKIIGATAADQVGSRTATQAAKEIVAKLGGATIEGATFMAPQAVTEAVLGDPEAAAESLMSGGLVGGAFGGATMLGSKLIKAGAKLISPEKIETAGQAISETGKSALEVATGINRQAMNRYIENPDAINAAKSLPEITDDFLEKVKQVREEGTLSSAKSRQILEQSPVSFSANEISAPFVSTIDKLGEIAKVNPNAEKALNSIVNYGAQLEKVAIQQGGIFKANQVKDVLGYLDSLVSYEGSKEFGLDKLVENQIKGIRRNLDFLIKDTIPEYAEHMSELSEATKVAKDVASSFRSEKGAENLLKRIMSGKDRFTEAKLEKFDEFFGTNYVNDLKDSYTKQAFEKETTNGSRKALTYGSAGAGLGGAFAGPMGALVGGSIGAVTGAAADKFGTGWVKKALDIVETANKQVTETTGKLQGMKPWLEDLKKSGKVKGAAVMPLNQFFNDERKENDDQALEKIQSAAATYVSNPALLQQKIKTFTQPLRDANATKVADQLEISLQKSVQYVYDNMPKEMLPQSPFAPKIKMKPSPSAMSDFKNKLEVLKNPWSILDHVKDNTLSPAHVHSLQSNYPALYNYMKVHVQHSAATNPVPLSYQRRIALGTLFGMSLDTSLEPSKLLDLQTSFIAPEDGSKERQAEIDVASQAILGTDKFQKA
jgi:hypothetical protein